MRTALHPIQNALERGTSMAGIDPYVALAEVRGDAKLLLLSHRFVYI